MNNDRDASRIHRPSVTRPQLKTVPAARSVPLPAVITEPATDARATHAVSTAATHTHTAAEAAISLPALVLLPAVVPARAHAAKQRELEEEPEPRAAVLRGVRVRRGEDGGLLVLVTRVVWPRDDRGVGVHGDDAMFQRIELISRCSGREKRVRRTRAHRRRRLSSRRIRGRGSWVGRFSRLGSRATSRPMPCTGS